MREFFLDGGVGMFPTMIFGLAALVLAGVYAAQPRARLVPLISGLGGASLLAGTLGTVLGFKATVAAIVGTPSIADDQLKLIALAGASESVNNLLLALGLTTLVALALGLGGFRARMITPAPSVS